MDQSIIELMKQRCQTPRAEDIKIHDYYMGIGGLLYFKCLDCKCWCLYNEASKDRHCNFCRLRVMNEEI